MNRSVFKLWLISFLLLLSTASKAQENVAPATRRLEFRGLTEKAQPADLPSEAIEGLILPGSAVRHFSPVVAVGPHTFAVASSLCSVRRNCRHFINLVEKISGALKLKRAIPLPLPPRLKIWNVEGIRFDAALLFDLNNDGQDEFLLQYSFSEPPRPALGFFHHTYLAVFDLPHLSLAWLHEISRGGQASIDERMEWDLDYGDLNGDGLNDLKLSGTFNPGHRQCPAMDEQPHCLAPRTLNEIFYWKAKARKYLPARTF